MSIKEIDSKYIASTYQRFDLEITRGQGSLLYGADGKEYIDLSSGIATNTFGTCDEAWVQAVSEQLNLFQHTSNLYYGAPSAKLARLLCERTGAGRVFFSNSGAEANECAIKVARKWAYDKKGEGHHNVITLKNSFHGRTVTTLSATGQDSFHTLFHPFTEGFLYLDPSDPSELSRLAARGDCCAIMLETVQGEGGVNPISAELASEVMRVSREWDLLVIVDEVQTGNGRTGTLYSYEQFNLTPDIVTTAKGLGGGLPIGATLLFERTEQVLTPGTHGSTFGGNPVACAGAISIISRIDESLLSEVRAKSEYIRKELDGVPGIEGISGLGLMLGLTTTKDATQFIKECMALGVLPIKAKNKVRLLPPLNIPWELLTRAAEVIKTVARG